MPNTADYVAALNALLNMPDYDGTPATSQQRLRIKNAAKRLVKAYTDNKALPKGALAKPLKVK